MANAIFVKLCAGVFCGDRLTRVWAGGQAAQAILGFRLSSCVHGPLMQVQILERLVSTLCSVGSDVQSHLILTNGPELGEWSCSCRKDSVCMEHSCKIGLGKQACTFGEIHDHEMTEGLVIAFQS